MVPVVLLGTRIGVGITRTSDIDYNSWYFITSFDDFTYIIVNMISFNGNAMDYFNQIM